MMGALLVVAAAGAGILLALVVGGIVTAAILHSIHALLQAARESSPEPGA